MGEFSEKDEGQKRKYELQKQKERERYKDLAKQGKDSVLEIIRQKEDNTRKEMQEK